MARRSSVRERHLMKRQRGGLWVAGGNDDHLQFARLTLIFLLSFFFPTVCISTDVATTNLCGFSFLGTSALIAKAEQEFLPLAAQ